MKKTILAVIAVFLVGTLSTQAASVSVNSVYDTVANTISQIKNAATAPFQAASFQATSTATSTFAGALRVVGMTSLATTTGRFYDNGGQVYNVRLFGAKGDGSTNDTASIQAALDFASTTCGTVYFPQGTYSTTLLQMRNCVSIRGAGIGSSIIKPPSSIGDNPVFNYQVGLGSTSPLTNVTISDLEFDGTNVPVTPTSTFRKAIYIVYSERLVLQNIYAHDFPSTCIGPDFMHGGTINNIYAARCGAPGANPGHNGLGIGIGGQTDEPLTISNVFTWDNANNGVLLEYVPDTPTNPFNAHNIMLTNIMSWHNKRGFRVSGGSNISITNCSMHDNTDHGMYFQNFGSAPYPVEDISVSNCNIYNNGDSGIEMVTYQPDNINPSILNNHIHDNTNYGIFLGGNGAVLTNNVVYNNTKTGIYYLGNSNNTRKGVSVTNNSVYDNGQLGVVGESDGIRVETGTAATSTISSLSVVGNQVFSKSTSTQINGITIKNNIDRANIVGNTVYGNTSSQLQQVSIPASSTVNIQGNIGISNSNSATSTPSVGSAGYIQFASSSAGYFDGSSSFIWDSVNKRLGIGTTAPDVGLHYVQTLANGTTTLKVQNNDTGGTQRAQLLLSLSSTLTNTSVGASILADRNNALSSGDTDLLFQNSRATTMGTNLIIKANGNIGIGTTTPTSLLTVVGTTSLATTTISGFFGIATTSPVSVFAVTGTSTLAGVTNISGALTAASTLAVTGTSNFTGIVTSSGALNANSSFTNTISNSAGTAGLNMHTGTLTMSNAALPVAPVGLRMIAIRSVGSSTAASTGTTTGIWSTARYSAASGTMPFSYGVAGAVENTGTGTTSVGYSIFGIRPLVSLGTMLQRWAGGFDGNVWVADNLSVGTTSIASAFQVASSTGTSTVTVDSASATKGSCLELKDSDGVGYTYVTVNNGVMTASTTSCK